MTATPNERDTSMSDYTPTTYVIRHAVGYPRQRLGEPREISGDEFDRWLAAHEAPMVARAEAAEARVAAVLEFRDNLAGAKSEVLGTEDLLDHLNIALSATEEGTRMSECGEARYAAFPPETLVESIYRMANVEGASDTEVAQLFGISQGHVWGIRTGRRWQEFKPNAAQTK